MAPESNQLNGYYCNLKGEYLMKVSVFGGGSTYTPELVKGFLERVETFPLKELWLMDVDAQRLEIVGGFVRRMVAARGNPFKVNLTTDQRAAIEGAAYVTTQLRVGQMAARREDEYLGRRHHLVGQETTGVGGMAKALRTIPVILKIASDMRSLAASGAVLVNFTNPSGLVTQALSMFAPDVTAVGVCNVPITAKMAMMELLEKSMGMPLDPARAELQTLGLNHLSWHRGFTLDGEDVWPHVLRAYIEQSRTEEDPEFDPRLVESLQMIPNYYLHYFYYTRRVLAGQEQWPPSRAEEVIDIEKDLLRQYGDASLNELPSDLMKRGGAYYSTMATQLLNAHYNNLGETHIVNVRQAGAVAGYPPDWVMEMPCKVDRSGFHPIKTKPLPSVCFGLLAQVKSYELLTALAAVNGDRNAAYQALLTNPLGPQADQAEAVLEDLLNTNRAYLPLFWQETKSVA
jgi:6-phospho-beta-glucosidase